MGARPFTSLSNPEIHDNVTPISTWIHIDSAKHCLHWIEDDHIVISDKDAATS